MRQFCVRALAAAVLWTGLVSGAGTHARAQHSRRSPIVDAVQKTRDSIVTIRVPKRGNSSRSDISGTGVVIDERGVIVTNRHVVGASADITVRLADGTNLPARVLLRDTNTDLAVLRVQAGRKLPALGLAPVSDLMVGETVIAVGHPFGYVNTVSTGIISALDREITMPTGEVLTGLIQTNASINPGNSGGPLLNINGELIGINVALREGAQGIAFAINAATVKELLRKRLSALHVAGVNHGLCCRDKVLGETGDRQRVVVAGITDETPAADIGLQRGDEILAVGARPVANSFDVERALWDREPGDKVKLKVRRQQDELTVTLTLSAGSEPGQLTQLFPEARRRPAPQSGGATGLAVAHRKNSGD
jgi:serine protease Do